MQAALRCDTGARGWGPWAGAGVVEGEVRV